MVNTAFNKQHIPVGKWRLAPPEILVPQRNEIINCLYERQKVAITYACGLVETTANTRLRDAAENRKLCRVCAAEYGLDPHMPGRPRPDGWWRGLDSHSNGRMYGIIPHPLPLNWRGV